MRDNLESKEWDDQKLNCIFLGVRMPWDQGFDQANVRCILFVKALSLESSAVGGMNQ